MTIRVKRAYEDPGDDDGRRILVDRLWPRGISKEDAEIDFWPRELAPSNELRKWYGHDPDKWQEFKQRYFAELDEGPAGLDELFERIREAEGPVTFVYSSKERELNNAVALKEYVEARL